LVQSSMLVSKPALSLSKREMEKEQSKIRDLRKKEKFFIDDAYLNGWAKLCGAYTTAVYCSLCRHANFYSQECFPSIQLISDELNISKKRVKKSIGTLRAYKIINVSQEKDERGRFKNNVYILLDKSKWSQSPRGLAGATDITEGSATVPREGVHKDNKLERTTNNITLKGKEETEQSRALILEHWNKKGIINHTKFNSDYFARLKKLIASYGIDGVLKAIDTYADVLKSPDTFFKYRWTLWEFLSRKNGLEVFVNKELRDYLKNKQSAKEQYEFDFNKKVKRVLVDGRVVREEAMIS